MRFILGVHPGAIPFHPLCKDVAVFLGKTCFYLPKLGLQFPRFVYEIFPNWVAPLQENKAIHQYVTP